MSFPTLLLSAAYASETGTVSPPVSDYDWVALLAFLLVVAAVLALPLGLVRPRLVPGSGGKRGKAALISVATACFGATIFLMAIPTVIPENAAHETLGSVTAAANRGRSFSAYDGLAIIASLVALAALLSLPVGLIKPQLMPGSGGVRWKAALNSVMAAYCAFAVCVIALALGRPDEGSGGVIVVICLASVWFVGVYGAILLGASLPALKLVRRLSLQHQDMLAAKWLQSVQIDEYGKMRFDQWVVELDYFVDSVIRPELNRFQREHYIRNVPRKAVMIITQIAAERFLELYAPKAEATEIQTGTRGDQMSYDAYIAEKLRHLGWGSVTVAGGVRGVIAAKRGIRVAIRPLLQDSPVDAPAIRTALAGRGAAQADHAAVVTNAGFTTAAERAAASIGVVLLLDSQLADLERLCEAVGGRLLA